MALNVVDLEADGGVPDAKEDTQTSGEKGIRTPGQLAPSAVFKTAALDHSAISPEETSVAKSKLVGDCFSFPNGPSDPPFGLAFQPRSMAWMRSRATPGLGGDFGRPASTQYK